MFEKWIKGLNEMHQTLSKDMPYYATLYTLKILSLIEKGIKKCLK